MKWWRRLRRLTVLRTVGIVLFAIGAAGVIAAIVLAVLDSPHAPSWLQVFAPMYLVMFGVFLLAARSFARAAMRIDLIPLAALPPELIPRPRRVTQTFVFRDVFRDLGVSALLSMVFMLAGGSYPRIREWSALKHRGVETTGIVTQRNVRDTGRSVFYSIRYRFGAFEGWDSVSEARYEKTAIGDRVPVTYLPHRPQISAAVRKADLTWTAGLDDLPLLGALLAATAVIGIAMMFLLHRVRERIEKLYGNGAAALAEIVNVTRSGVHYEFDANGERGKGFLVTAKKKPRVPPVAGQHIAVLYDPENPKTNVAVASIDAVTFEFPD